MFVYQQQKFESVPCTICNVEDTVVIGKRAGNGTPALTCMCRRCGLIYITPRMTEDGYALYYSEFYREDRTRSTGHAESAADLTQNFEDARRFGRALVKYLHPYIRQSGLTIDVGSSTGGVLKGLQESLPGLQIAGVEPSVAESSYAVAHGVPTTTALFEDFIRRNVVAPSSVSNMLCVRSLNHLLDPRAFFEWSRHVLKEGGRLILVVKNFRHQARRAGSIESGVQIDHPYMFTPETLRNIVEATGFRVLYLDSDEHKSASELGQQKKDGLSASHIRLVAEKNSEGEVSSLTDRKKKSTYRLLRIQFFRPVLFLTRLFRYSKRFRFS